MVWVKTLNEILQWNRYFARSWKDLEENEFSPIFVAFYRAVTFRVVPTLMDSLYSQMWILFLCVCFGVFFSGNVWHMFMIWRNHFSGRSHESSQNEQVGTTWGGFQDHANKWTLGVLWRGSSRGGPDHCGISEWWQTGFMAYSQISPGLCLKKYWYIKKEICIVCSVIIYNDNWVLAAFMMIYNIIHCTIFDRHCMEFQFHPNPLCQSSTALLTWWISVWRCVAWSSLIPTAWPVPRPPLVVPWSEELSKLDGDLH